MAQQIVCGFVLITSIQRAALTGVQVQCGCICLLQSDVGGRCGCVAGLVSLVLCGAGFVLFSQWAAGGGGRSAYQLATKTGVDMPITTGIYKVIHEGADPLEVVQEVMTRDLGPEVDIQVLEAVQKPPSAAPALA